MTSKFRIGQSWQGKIFRDVTLHITRTSVRKNTIWAREVGKKSKTRMYIMDEFEKYYKQVS